MRVAIPAFITIILMPLTYSIAYGIIGGLMISLFIKVVDVSVDMSKKVLILCQKEEVDHTDIDMEIAQQPQLEEPSMSTDIELRHNDKVELQIIDIDGTNTLIV